MKTKEAFVYWENDYDTIYFGKYNNDNLMWRYWVAKEMAHAICKEIHPELIDEDLYIYADGTKFIHRNYLTQVLKKEWFR